VHSNGHFREVEYESIVLLAAAAMLAVTITLPWPKKPSAEAESSLEKPIEEVIVTGTRRLDRTERSRQHRLTC